MPNWCFNNLRLKHADPAMIERVIEAFRSDRLLHEFIPAPGVHEDLLKAGSEVPGVSCEWCVTHWGTKWEIDGSNRPIHSMDPHEVVLDFDTANNPPLPLYEVLRGLGFQVIAVWAELGCRFCGSYGDAGVVRRYDIPHTAAECRERIPEEIDNAFEISAYVEETE